MQGYSKVNYNAQHNEIHEQIHPLDPVLHAFEDVVNLYNDFRSNVVRLQELKSALQATEGELDLLSQRLKEEKDAVSPLNLITSY